MRRFLILFILSLLVILSPVIAHALSADQISQIAKEITVLIDGCGSGSGILYKREGNTYSVLTANHVVNLKSGCLVIAPDKTRYPMSPNVTIPKSGIDAAIVQFTSDERYKLAEFGDSKAVTEGKTVYVSGAPAPSPGIDGRPLLFSPGNVMARPQPRNGYGLIYNNLTRTGMSGGAVLNEDGKVIGIHGRADEQNGSKINFGIPIHLLPNLTVTDLSETAPIQQSFPWTTVFYSIGGLGLVVGVGFGIKKLDIANLGYDLYFWVRYDLYFWLRRILLFLYFLIKFYLDDLTPQCGKWLSSCVLSQNQEEDFFLVWLISILFVFIIVGFFPFPFPLFTGFIGVISYVASLSDADEIGEGFFDVLNCFIFPVFLLFFIGIIGWFLGDIDAIELLQSILVILGFLLVYCVGFCIFTVPFYKARQELQKSVSQLYAHLIIISTILAGLLSGLLLYQIFPWVD